MDEPEARIAKLEQDVFFIREQGATKVDLAELKAELLAKLAVTKADILVRLAEGEGALRSDMSALRTDFERALSRQFRWLMAVILLAQLLPALLKHVG